MFTEPRPKPFGDFPVEAHRAVFETLVLQKTPGILCQFLLVPKPRKLPHHRSENAREGASAGFNLVGT